MFAHQDQTRLKARRRMQFLTVLFLLAIVVILGIGVYVLLSVDITPDPVLVEEAIPNDRFF